MKKVRYDEIGYWSEVKLDIVREYASAYSIILNNQRAIRKHIYIDAFAGAGKHISRKTGEFVPGSPRNALLINPPFSEFHLIDLDGTRAAQLRNEIGIEATCKSTKAMPTRFCSAKSFLDARMKTFIERSVSWTLMLSTLIGRSSRQRVRWVRSRSSTTS